MRAFAIVFVFISHLPLPNLPNWLSAGVTLGWSGVDLFFVLSGFLIATQLFSTIDQKHWISLFYLKRFFRIVPAYIVVVAVYFLVPAFREGGQLPPLWRFLTFTQNIAPDPAVQGAFFHAWSLCIEEQFYLFFPIVLLALLRFNMLHKGFYIVAGLFLLTCILRWFTWHYYIAPLHLVNAAAGDRFWLQWIYCAPYTRLDGFLAGIAIAGFYRYFPKQKEQLLKYGNLLLVAGIVVLLIAFLLSIKRISFNATVFGMPLLAAGYGLLVLAALSPACFLYKYPSRITAFIAALSYSIYLIHRGIIYLCGTLLPEAGITNPVVVITAGILFTIAGALLLRYVAEKPGLKARTFFIRKYYS